MLRLRIGVVGFALDLLPCEVDRAFDPEQTGVVEPQQGQKRQLCEVQRDRATRHRMWLGCTKHKAASWRPKKTHRHAAKRWLSGPGIL